MVAAASSLAVLVVTALLLWILAPEENTSLPPLNITPTTTVPTTTVPTTPTSSVPGG
jgi:hypothetical protein